MGGEEIRAGGNLEEQTMKTLFGSLTLNRALFLAALVLGLLAVIAGDPYVGSSVTIDSKELSLIVERGTDHVDAVEVADWIIQGRRDYRLLDLRDEAAFAQYHIPTAENVSPSSLDDYPLARNEKIVLYSDGGIHAAQSWFLMKARKYRGVYILRGGLEEWKDAVLFPEIPVNPTPEQMAAYEKARSVAAYFGGAPRSGSGSKSAPELTMPKLDAPSPTVPSATGARKKKKEGC
jgi:rhodanese-related sulfurtransferase